MRVLSALTKRVGLLLAIALAARVVAMAVLPLTDPTEGRYAQVSQEMALTGDWITPRVWIEEAHIPFLGKPPLFFWIAAGFMKVCGVSAFAARLPSMLAAVGLLLLLYVVLERRVGRGAGQVGVLVTASSCFFFAIAGCVAVDMLLCCCVAGSLLAYFAFAFETDAVWRGRWSLAVFGFLGLGLLAKGPVALALFGLPVLFWTVRRRAWALLRHHRWFAGCVLFVGVAVPWYALCERHNPGFLKYFLINENVLRFVTHDYGDAYGTGHLYPRGTALAMFIAATAPWSLLVAWRAVRDRDFARSLWPRDSEAGFLAASFVAGTLFWCLARQLLVTYLLPMVPLFAAWLVWVTRDRAELWRSIRQASALLLVAMSVCAMLCGVALKDAATARGVVARARAYAAAEKFGGPLIFERRTPYSALFYGRSWVLPHPKEELTDSVRRLAASGTDRVLLAIAESREGKLAVLPRGCATTVTKTGGWLLADIKLSAAARTEKDSSASTRKSDVCRYAHSGR